MKLNYPSNKNSYSNLDIYNKDKDYMNFMTRKNNQKNIINETNNNNIDFQNYFFNKSKRKN